MRTEKGNGFRVAKAAGEEDYLFSLSTTQTQQHSQVFLLSNFFRPSYIEIRILL